MKLQRHCSSQSGEYTCTDARPWFAAHCVALQPTICYVLNLVKACHMVTHRHVTDSVELSYTLFCMLHVQLSVNT